MTTKNRTNTKPKANSGRKAASSTRPKSKATAPKPSLLSQAWVALTDGRGHDLIGLLLIIVAIISGASIYSGADSAPGSWPDTAIGVLFGGLRFLLPPVLIYVGVVLIRGPRSVDVDLSDEDAHWDAPVARRSELTRAIGVVLAVLVLAGVLDLIWAEGRTITADGFDGYAGGGGLVGAAVGALATLGGRWVALAVLVLVGILCVSLISGLPLRDLARRLWQVLKPGLDALVSGLAGLFRISGTHGENNGGTDDAAGEGGHGHGEHDSGANEDEDRSNFFDQDAGGVAPRTKRQRKSPVKPVEPKVVISSRRSGDTDATEQLQMDLEPPTDGSPWRLPPLGLLSRSTEQEVDQDAVAEKGRRLEGALAEHGVETRLIGMTVGPAATCYELELGTAVKVARVTALHKDIAYAMATPDVRLLAPIPGRRAIGVEVPNETREIVTLGDILTSSEARAAKHPLEVGIGRGMNGENVMLNLATTPHILIAGQTGAGKSSCINSVLTSLMMRTTPEQVRLILIDPKQVELTQYRKIPHLLTQVVTDPKKAANALNWATVEMDRRYTFLSEIGVRDIGGYNRQFRSGELGERFPERELKEMPFIVVVVDELSDLMLVAAKEVEHSITRIASKARAVGIHLVLATQRPSADVITGLIKANVPARLSFTVASSIDSKVILDQVGAERLTGQGDMLLLAGNTTPQRIQGAWVEESEVRDVANQWHMQAPLAEDSYVAEIVSTQSSGASLDPAGGGADDDDLLLQALELVVRSQQGSTSMLQRKLKVGFARAGRLMDLLEERGVVGQSEGSKAREVLMTPEELDHMIEAGEI